MPIKVRPHPAIPDHEVLRKIGGGAYGEVWLAKGVTGALRAVKVLWREDFEDERTFEREFEGILKFEPISRDHPALVNILHVGRSPDGAAFYYYVMELGDDIRTGQDINPVEYEPRTLRADHKQAPGHRWETHECIDAGLRLAEALGHLHGKGLAHRDVKPSNVIFVNGRAKLADIGLVAARGQRTFVGTEGFVPPEGPGSEQADVYSLGKVLYEIASGKDRLDFPDLPEDLPTGAEGKHWLELNKIICEVCEPRISKRTISTAADLADALRRLQHGKRRRIRGRAAWITSTVLVAFAAAVSWLAVKDSQWFAKVKPPEAPVPPAIGKLWVQSIPEGADVYDSHGNFMGTTPLPTMEATVGQEVSFTIRKSRFLPREVKGKLEPSSVNEPLFLLAVLTNFTPPEKGIPWNDQFGATYLPQGAEHVSSSFISRKAWQKFVDWSMDAKKPGGIVRKPGHYEFYPYNKDGKVEEIALVRREDQNAFSQWLREDAITNGYLSKDQECLVVPAAGFAVPDASETVRKEGLEPFQILVRQIPYGSITIITDPPGAEVFLNGESKGVANGPLVIAQVKPGNADLSIISEGYKPASLSVTVEENKDMPVNVNLVKNRGVIFGAPWENGLQMKFVPLGENLMVCIWETRLKDYRLFLKEPGQRPYQPPDFPQTSEHPVVNVTRQNAEDFCKWLTRREQKEENIAPTHVYRLPTDLEWSRMAGLEEEKGTGPAWRDARKTAIFPWGSQWPPPARTGNFADASTVALPGMMWDRTIEGYEDGFTCTAPVGSFPPNALGIYDLSGNVQEWVKDDYIKMGNTLLGVLRGGGWNTYQQQNLYTGARNAVPVNFADTIYGFRVVLSKNPLK